jgi:hypothetical protein
MRSVSQKVYPEMPRHRLSSIKPMVKQICQKYNIHYHDTSLIGGTLEVLKTLDFVQSVSQKLGKKML